MINWEKETTKKNYCGYCIGSPPSADCDGSCFNYKYASTEQICANRKNHIEYQLKEISELRKKIDEREQDLINELNNLLYEK